MIDICHRTYYHFAYQPGRITTFDVNYNNNNILANTLNTYTYTYVRMHTFLSFVIIQLKYNLQICYQGDLQHNIGILINGVTIRSGTVHHVVFIDINFAMSLSFSLFPYLIYLYSIFTICSLFHFLPFPFELFGNSEIIPFHLPSYSNHRSYHFFSNFSYIFYIQLNFFRILVNNSI